MELYTLIKTQNLENHTLFSGTYPYRANKGVPPRGAWFLSSFGGLGRDVFERRSSTRSEPFLFYKSLCRMQENVFFFTHCLFLSLWYEGHVCVPNNKNQIQFLHKCRIEFPKVLFCLLQGHKHGCCEASWKLMKILITKMYDVRATFVSQIKSNAQKVWTVLFMDTNMAPVKTNKNANCTH